MASRQKQYAKQFFTQTYGINKITAQKIIGKLGLHPRASSNALGTRRLKDVITDTLGALRIGFRLRLIIFSRLCRIISTGSYRGLRISQGLPTRGQRTHANGKTLKSIKQNGNFFPFRIRLIKHAEPVNKKKSGKTDKAKNKKTSSGKKISSKQKAKIKAKNKAKAKAKKKAKS